ncbi:MULTISPECIES: discoidin domain-containing protein [unclassified Microbacterium]|uniref:discoidin domain-containing protein n=1 Tax=unclassified Microbacterium TaxID=2609290 RepID=UPI0012FB8B64|nr:discoidin domain-containing protein [Microbacterium sp. MAH-37]MVQ44065.1 hypothetical protein [Microbacterium sp. MAH-37]
MRTAVRPRSRLLATAVALVIAIPSIIGFSVPMAVAAEDPADLSSYAPPGTVNIGPNAQVLTDTAQQLAPRLVDTDLGESPMRLWVAGNLGADAGGQVTLTLRKTAAVHRVVVFPRADPGFYGVYFPIDYTVSLLDAAGASLWSTRITHPDSPENIIDAPDVVDLPTPTEARQVRIDVLKRQAREGGIFQLSEVAVFADPPAPPVDYQPAGTINLARTSAVTASSSYEKPDETWSAAFAVNGVDGPADGWSTDPYERNQDPLKPAAVTLQLRCTSDLARVVVYPRQANFPKDLGIDVSSDGTTWTSIGRSLGNPGIQDEPQVFDAPAGTTARFVRLNVETRNGPSGNDGYLAQISELAAFGTAENCVTLVKPALLLEPGMTDDSWFDALTPASTYSVSSSKPQVATVDSSGAITARKKGTTAVTLKAGEHTLTVPVTVVPQVERVGDEFSISAFWPPTVDHVDDEQYRNMADAGIDLIENVQAETITTEQNLKLAALAHEYGMQIVAQDGAVSPSLTTMSAADAAAYAKRFMNVPGIGGVFLVDEPADATDYAQSYNAIREAAPEYYPHLNFFPYNVYGSASDGVAAMQKWLDATGSHSIDGPEYLMYDRYPFEVSRTTYEEMFTNLNTVRELGLKNDIKTSTYLQSIGITDYMRRPTAEEIRYEANVALAYGYKQLSYFTWWTPTKRSQDFTDGIMTADGEKTDLYAPVQQLNAEIHALGPTLMRLDAEEVYLAGAAYGQATVPADWFVQPVSTGDLVISRMVDRKNGDEYLFVVNNSFTDGQDMTLRIGDSVKAVREVKRSNGKTGGRITLSDGSLLTDRLAASEGVLYKLER